MPFVVMDDRAQVVPEANDFLVYLAARGAASYTLRSYALGLAHFLSWLAQRGVGVADVDKGLVVEYVGGFRRDEKGGATRVRREPAGQVHPLTRKPYPSTERQARTVNHRLSVLSSFFGFLIERDTSAGGRWGDQENPVPGGRDPAEDAHGSPGRDMGTHLCALPTGEHCPKGLVCLGCVHAQPKRSAVPVFRRMLASHQRALARARDNGEPAGQIAARELEVARIGHALHRAEELPDEVDAAIDASAGPALIPAVAR